MLCMLRTVRDVLCVLRIVRGVLCMLPLLATKRGVCHERLCVLCMLLRGAALTRLQGCLTVCTQGLW